MSAHRLLAVLGAAVLLGGCDLLATRDPEVEGSQESLWTPPTSPEIVVTNLELAWEIGNFNDYGRALRDEFTFTADPADAAQLEIEYPGVGVLDGWDAQVEVDVASNIRGAVDSLAVELVMFDDDLGQSVRLLKYDYTVSLFQGGTRTDYVGEAWFHIAEEGGEWLIRDWEDVSGQSGADSWGLLKGRNRFSSS